MNHENVQAQQVARERKYAIGKKWVFILQGEILISTRSQTLHESVSCVVGAFKGS